MTDSSATRDQDATTDLFRQGWQLTADHDQVFVEHHCGYRIQVEPLGPGYLANVIADIALPHNKSGCRRVS
jgi:hypothetical protein